MNVTGNGLIRGGEMITVYGVGQSRSTRVLWALEEAGQEYEYVRLDFSQQEHKADSFLSINPAGKVPALKHDDFVLTESAAIVNYIASEFSDSLIPKGDAQLRAVYDRWCYFVLSELEQGLWTMGKHRFALPAQYRVREVLETANWEHQQALQLLSRGLGKNRFILGDEFSAADILIAQTLLWGLAFKRPLEHENLQAYLKRIEERPALQRAQQREAE